MTVIRFYKIALTEGKLSRNFWGLANNSALGTNESSTNETGSNILLSLACLLISASVARTAVWLYTLFI